MGRKMNGIGEKEPELQAGMYVIELLRAVLEERKPKEKPEMLSMGSIYRMAKKHSVECMAYDGAVQIAKPGDEAVMQKWKEGSRLCAMQDMVQKAESRQLFEELPAHGVRILPLKGCILKKLYPKEAYRQMTDLDILIEEENAGKAREVMKSLGYAEKPEWGGVNIYVKEPWMCIELHRRMLPTEFRNWKRYLNIWDRAVGNDGVYRMTWDDYYIYMIEHFAKHYYVSGSGIRSVLDIHIFLTKMKTELHPDYLEAEFRERKLQKFRTDMEELAQDWFSKGAAEEMQEKGRKVISSGTYGTEEGYFQNLEEELKEKYRVSWLVKVIYVFKRTFPGYRVMYDTYLIVKKVPLLLPVMWIYRIMAAIMKRPEKIVRELNFINRKEKEQQEKE